MEILIKALIISLFCVGLRIISGPGMLLYFLRMPYEYYKNYGVWAKHFEMNESFELPQSAIRRYNLASYLLKPIIGCGTCMASVWTIVIELGYYNTFTIQSVIIAFVVAALNSIIHAYYEKLTK